MHDEDGASGADHIGSSPSTPPNGTATPRPDLHDKRLPQIASSYFAQVSGESFPALSRSFVRVSASPKLLRVEMASAERCRRTWQARSAVLATTRMSGIASAAFACADTNAAATPASPHISTQEELHEQP